MICSLCAVASDNITFSGSASLASYQQALASVVYFNSATEPSEGIIRAIQFQVFDGTFSSPVLTGLVNITLVDDNPLILQCGVGVVSFTEGSTTPISLAGLLTVSDLDADHEVLSASVAIGNTQQGDEIAVDAGLSSSINVRSTNGSSIELVGIATDTQYQVGIAGIVMV